MSKRRIISDLCFMIIAIGMTLSAASADTLEFLNGTKLEGEFLGGDSLSVAFRAEEKTKVYKIEEIANLIFTKNVVGEEQGGKKETPRQIADSYKVLKLRYYSEVTRTLTFQVYMVYSSDYEKELRKVVAPKPGDGHILIFGVSCFSDDIFSPTFKFKQGDQYCRIEWLSQRIVLSGRGQFEQKRNGASLRGYIILPATFTLDKPITVWLNLGVVSNSPSKTFLFQDVDQ